jgi:cytosine/adenosine deaminase-related metal-dependent hydrolase
MIQAGVNVALGTDGLPCLDRADRLSVLDDMRLLYRRDDADPDLLLRMATTAGAVGLGMDPDLVTLAPGPVAGLIALGYDPADPADAFEQVLQSDNAPEWIIR